jgi:hypothetical protein
MSSGMLRVQPGRSLLAFRGTYGIHLQSGRVNQARRAVILVLTVLAPSTLQIEAVYLSEMSENVHQTIRRNFVKDNTLINHV